jgi:lysophospholipase L1-like esterase
MYRLFALTILAAFAGNAAADDFPLKDNDVWVMAGDSITAQHLHSNYFEAFCYARYPNITFAFRNSGVGGHTIPSTLARFDYDIAAWKPTVVSVELGMNDAGGTATDKFISNMGTMVERIRKSGARPVILSASPVNDGTVLAKAGGRNLRLSEYAIGLKAFSEKEKLPYADQFHMLLDVWGKNKPRESLQNAIGVLKGAANDDTIAGVEHLRAFLADQAMNPAKGVSLHGDAVHPGAPGQLMMAAALLKALNADPMVSSAILEATGKVTEAKGCTIANVVAGDGTLTFDRTDTKLPFPIPEDARSVLTFDPTITELSQYVLTVTGLKDGKYALKINGEITGNARNAREWAAGVNLTGMANEPELPATDKPKPIVNPIATQAKAILAAVNAKENIVSQFRALSAKVTAAKGADQALNAELAALGNKAAEADAKIREAAKPQTLKFELVLVK